MARVGRKVRIGRVIGDKMDKTVKVAVRWQTRHPLYKKSLRRISRFYAHDKDNECKLGDLVRIQETRPLSRLKHWRVLEILERREVAEVKPIDLEEVPLSEEEDVEAEDGVDEEEDVDAEVDGDEEGAEV